MTQAVENSSQINVKEIIRARTADVTCAKLIKDCEKHKILKFWNKHFKVINNVLLAGNSHSAIEKIVLPKIFNKSVVKAIRIANLYCGIYKCASIVKKKI